MKYLPLFIFQLLLSGNQVAAQSRKSIRVKAGEDIAQAYSPNGFYRFPKFGKALLFYKGGGQNAGQLVNYNILSGTMQFIKPDGKTFNMVDLSKIDSVVFEKNTFIYRDGFMENITQTNLMLLLKRIIIKTRVEKIGALGLPNQSSSIDNISIYSAETDAYHLAINSDIVITENISWFWMDRSNTVLKANKANFLKLIPAERQGSAETYIKQHKIDFDKEDDLKDLTLNLAVQ